MRIRSDMKHVKVFIVHGMDNPPRSLEMLSKKFYRSGFDVSMPRMPSLTNREAPKKWPETWVDEALENLEAFSRGKSGFSLIIIGYSIGGAIAANVAFLLSRQAQGRAMMMPCTLLLLSVPAGIDHELIKYWGSVPSGLGKLSFLGLCRLVSFLRGTDKIYGFLNMPCLIAQGAKDRLVPVRCSEWLFNNIGSKKKCLVVHPALDHNLYEESNRCNDAFLSTILWRVSEFIKP